MKTLIKSIFVVDENIRLVVMSRNVELFRKFNSIIYKKNLAINRNIFKEDLCIMVLKLKSHKQYMLMMKTLQENGINLRQTDEDDLINDLVEF